ncbi:succinate-semialdehyde dehydrogenase / glutarate-semialdehyde dehydrogenase [Aureimonas altamirensis DSM 21988]|uniref:NADP+ dependent succinate-semialdehyde dehydrogenase n=2 Tax=Aureimonas altamirensis TaxID=370622 RepID=A0A0P0YVZ6_9HYPH|nr:NAD-dependent succinate-semialdehyde dehydrogenase [Aureimonas altamirensis]BAT25468.1 NADP+ dependent succinate-semialdehyde dehydrogenase [Aureimonas altamirensis]SHK01837.1 succinate-semialdehyde dehydrogenase / glutarate-semialdehyde dehydrogenase [Aureimonas altamirensis DSM 21988]
MAHITSTNPATGLAIDTYELHNDAAVDKILDAAVDAQRAWRAVPIEQRVGLLTRMAEALRSGKSRYAEMIVREMGKPIAEAEAEIEKCAYNCDFYAEHAVAYLSNEPVPSNASESVVAFDPLGVVLAIMPWNYPFWQYFRFAAPALAAGNGSVLKHANNVPECALAVQEVMEKAGAPAGLTATLLIDNSKVAALIADDRIAAVTLTGSTEVGSIVASQAGKALKKQVLELGGSDPFIVLADADIEKAAETAVKARYINVGQSCVNAKRFIVEDSVADRFVELFVEHAKALKVGDPMARDTNIGPMARENLRSTLHAQVERSVEGGATLALGGTPVDGPGYFYAPTVLDNVTPDHVAFREETFGPVAAIIRAKDADEAIRLANDSEFGLGSALWTADIERAKQLARSIEAGAVFINGMTASDPRYPFGGIKRSGYGRELGVYGIREFTNIKTVWIGPANAAQPVEATK